MTADPITQPIHTEPGTVRRPATLRRQRRRIAAAASLAPALSLAATLVLSPPAAAAPATPSNRPMVHVEQGVPVTLAKVAREDVPVLAQGLGTVQAWRSVTVRAQVSGLLTQVAFQEGQPVRQGDLLASIDPRPYAALLAGAQAKLAGDRTDLVNAQLNHGRDLKLAQDQFGSQQQADNALSLVQHLRSIVQSDIAAAQQAQLSVDFCSVTARSTA